MNSFNWTRAAEGAVVSGLLAGTAVLEPLANGASINPKAIGIAFSATVLCSFIKGIGQSYQQATMVTTTITQPTNTTALTETVASPTSPKPSIE